VVEGLAPPTRSLYEYAEVILVLCLPYVFGKSPRPQRSVEVGVVATPDRVDRAG
jgi:hypothetical protein